MDESGAKRAKIDTTQETNTSDSETNETTPSCSAAATLPKATVGPSSSGYNAETRERCRTSIPLGVDSDEMYSDHEMKVAGVKINKFRKSNRVYRVRPFSDSSSDDELTSNANAVPQQQQPQEEQQQEEQPQEQNENLADSSDGTSSLASTVPATVSSPFENSDSHRSGSSRSNAPPSNSDSESDHVPFRPHTVVEGLTNAIIRKQKSKYQWFSVPSIMHRQNGFSAGKKLRHVADSRNFSAAFCGSLHAVERMELMASLRGHNKCVNCLNFNRNGKLLASGSDDLKIKIWDWARQKAIVAIKTSHTANIYQTKFVDYKACTDINFDIVSSDQRGDVRYFSVSPCGSVRVNKLLVSKSRPIHSLGLPANCPNEVLLAAQDCSVMLIDLREDRTSELVRSSFPLYCLSCHPLDSNIFCVGGRKEFIQIYDRRKGNIPTRSLCPVHLEKKPDSMISVTSVVYNYTGNEILASYAAENIYLFDSSKEKMGRVLHRYSGHRNIRTIKGVEFYGPRSEFIISGSEYPGHLFFWEKQTEAIVQMFNADSGGILNCLEPHPSLPVIATSGLSNSVKLWYPASTTEPNFMHLRSDVFRNVNYVLNRRNRNTELDIFQFILQRMRRRNAAEVDNQPIDFGSESDSSSEHETEVNSCSPS